MAIQLTKRGIIAPLLVVCGTSLLVASWTADRRLESRLRAFITSVDRVRLGMSDQQVRSALGEPNFAGVVETGSHLAQLSCREAGGRQVMAYRFEFRTWKNAFGPVGSEQWAVVCFDEKRTVVKTAMELVRY